MSKIKYPDPLHKPVTSRILILSLLGYNTKQTIKQKIPDFNENTISDGIQALVRDNYLLCFPVGENKKKFYYPPNRQKIKEDLLERQVKFLDPSFYLGKERVPKCYALMQEAEKKIKELKNPIYQRRLHQIKYRNETNEWRINWENQYLKSLAEETDQIFAGLTEQTKKDKEFLNLVKESTPSEIIQLIEDYLDLLKAIPESKEKPVKSFFIDHLQLITNFETIYSLFFSFVQTNREEILARNKDNKKLVSYLNGLMLNKTNNQREQALASLFAIEENPSEKLKEMVKQAEIILHSQYIKEKYKDNLSVLGIQPVELHNRTANNKMKQLQLKNKLRELKESKKINSIFE